MRVTGRSVTHRFANEMLVSVIATGSNNLLSSVAAIAQTGEARGIVRYETTEIAVIATVLVGTARVWLRIRDPIATSS